jgi:two-component system copper resistance phosphate regulon response regulator CusR
MKLLLVEDEPRLAGRIGTHLRRQGFSVDVTADGADALARAKSSGYDCVLLDLALPGGIDGLEICRELRRARVQTSILMITARDALSSRIEGLDAGADDYLVKPFALDELSARIRAVLRRSTRTGPRVVEVHDVRLDTARRVGARGRHEFTLTGRECTMLELFMQRAGEPLDRAEISRHVWDDSYDPASNIIDVYVARLRHKLEALGARRLIHTLRGQGYFFGEGPEAE